MPEKKNEKPTARKEKAPATGRIPKSEAKEFKDLLTRRLTQLKRDVDQMGNDALNTGTDASGELSTMPLHMADVGTDTFEQDMTLGRLESESRELEEIQEAIKRISVGTYGLCESCQKPIPKVRLRAIPYARLCIPCKEKEESA